MPRRERLYRPPSQPIAQSTQNFCRFREFLLLSGLPPKLKAPAYKIKLAGIILYAFHRMNTLTAINVQCDLWIDSNTSSPDSSSSVLVQARRQSIRFSAANGTRTRVPALKGRCFTIKALAAKLRPLLKYMHLFFRGLASIFSLSQSASNRSLRHDFSGRCSNPFHCFLSKSTSTISV